MVSKVRVNPALAACMLASLVGCDSIRNGWLDPTVVGNYHRIATNEIRTALTLEDTSGAIPGSQFPSPMDLEFRVRDYPISGGDTLDVSINELRLRQVAYRDQVPVSSSGYVNLPVVGRIQAVRLTVPQFEKRVIQTLQDRNILRHPEVTINPLFLQKATYSIFGIGVSASNTAPLRAGTFPINRPDLRVLEAINQVGGLSEFVTDVYVFRHDQPYKGPPNPVEGGTALSRDVSGQPFAGSVEEAGTEKVRPTPEKDEAEQDSPPALVKDVIDVVEDEVDGEEALERKAIMDSVERDGSDPFVFVNGEWVPDPAFQGPSPGVGLRSGEGHPFDLARPGAKWARIAGESTYRVIRIPADPLRAGDPEANIYVRAGDVIRIVSGEIGVYYVMGQVNRVGPFPFNAETITLKAAIAAAGGLSSLAWPDRCTIYRRLGQREQMIQVNLDRIFAGKDQDFVIRRGDIINVGTHPFAPFLQRIRSLTLPNITSNVGYSFTYARNFADIDSFAVKQNPANKPSRFPNLFP